ncbi:unnamed protein product [Rhizophagus irregularis]|nr:unnamed protein product [Rhizophagus irregularis]
MEAGYAHSESAVLLCNTWDLVFKDTSNIIFGTWEFKGFICVEVLSVWHYSSFKFFQFGIEDLLSSSGFTSDISLLYC